MNYITDEIIRIVQSVKNIKNFCKRMVGNCDQCPLRDKNDWCMIGGGAWGEEYRPDDWDIQTIVENFEHPIEEE